MDVDLAAGLVDVELAQARGERKVKRCRGEAQ